MRRELNFYYAPLTERDVWLAAARASGGREQLERWFYGYAGGSAHAYSGGRVALRAILRAAGIGEGDEVVVTSFTCLAVPEAVRYVPATPVFADVAPGGWAAGADEIVRVATTRTRAVVVQHTFGIATPVAPVRELCRRNGWLLVEDCALALGSRGAEGVLGSLGDAAIYSFELSKGVTCGWGGVAVVREPRLRAAMAAAYAAEPRPAALRVAREMLQIAGSTLLYKPGVFGMGKYALAALYRSGAFRMSGRPLRDAAPAGWSTRLSDVQAALAMRQLERLDALRAHARRIVAIYRGWLDRTKRADVSGARDEAQHLLRFPLLIEDAQACVHEAAAQGIELGRWFAEPGISDARSSTTHRVHAGIVSARGIPEPARDEPAGASPPHAR